MSGRISRSAIEVCDCDLKLDPHPMDKDHYRACRAPYENADLTGIYCFVIKGHKGPHKAEVIQVAEWEDTD